MSQKAGILSIICAKRQRNHEFSETAKALIVQAVESGRSYRDVATEAGCSPAAIFKIFQRRKTHQTLDKKSRSGRPRKLTVQQIRYVLISLKRDRRITYEMLVNFLGGEISRTTLRRVIRYHYGRKWRAMQRIPHYLQKPLVSGFLGVKLGRKISKNCWRYVVLKFAYGRPSGRDHQSDDALRRFSAMSPQFNRNLTINEAGSSGSLMRSL
jgi:transposase